MSAQLGPKRTSEIEQSEGQPSALSERELIMLCTLEDTFPSLEQVATPEGVRAVSWAELERLTGEERRLIEPELLDLCQGGKNIVFVGGPKRRENLIYIMMGAMHQQRGNGTNLFVMPIEGYRRFARGVEAARTSQGALGAEVVTVRKAIEENK